MKHLIVMVVILALTVTGALLWGSYINNEALTLENIANEAISCINNEDYSKAEEHMDRISDIWEEKERLWSMAIDHSVLHDIEMHCLRAKEYIRKRDKSHALAELESMRLSIEEMRKANEFSIMNIL